MSPELKMIPIGKITVEDNPRDTFSKKGEPFKQLVESVRQHGIITPITVQPETGGVYKLIAGQRRLAAADEAGLVEIPAQIMDANGSANVQSVVENIHREALTPMQEARAFAAAKTTMSVGDIAKSYAVSADLVRERIRLLKLPKALQKGVDSREVPIGAANTLAEIAENSEGVAKAIAKQLIEKNSEVTLTSLTQNTAHVVKQSVDLSDDHDLVAFDVDTQVLRPPDVRAFSQEQIDELEKLWQQKSPSWYSTLLEKSDVDAARAYGCLLTITDSYNRTAQLITDPEFLFDRLKARLEKIAAKGEQERKKQSSAKATTTPAGAVGPSGKKEKSEEEKAAARVERDAAKVAKIAAISRNAELGAHLATVAKELPVDKDLMCVLGELLIDKYGVDLFMRGFRYTAEIYKTVEPGKRDDSVPKVERVSTREEAEAAVRDLWSKQKTVPQMAGFLTQLLVSAYYADQQETSQADRRSNPIPWLSDWSGPLPTVSTPSPSSKALDRIATRVIPKPVKAWAKETREQTEEKKREAQARTAQLREQRQQDASPDASGPDESELNDQLTDDPDDDELRALGDVDEIVPDDDQLAEELLEYADDEHALTEDAAA